MTDFIQRREINAFHICFDLVIAERVTRLRNQADKCVLAVVKDNKLMVAGVNMLAPGAHSQFGSGKNTQFEPEQRANPFENVFSKTAVFPPPAIAETDL